jgi:thiol peroxidase
MHLEEEPLDIGYASEKVTLKDVSGKEQVIGGQNGTTQVIITTPFVDEQFKEELRRVRETLPNGGEYEVNASVVVAHENHDNPQIDDIAFLVDHDNEFGDWYGVRLADGPCEKELTKALFVISKDGALFYDEFVTNLHDQFNLDTLLRKVSAAQLCYTGKGCH